MRLYDDSLRLRFVFERDPRHTDVDGSYGVKYVDKNTDAKRRGQNE